MTIKQLIKKLSKLDQDSEIIIASDSEGNSYNRFTEISHSAGLRYVNEPNEHSFGITLIEKYEVDEGEIDLKDYNKAKPCVVFYP